MVASGCVLRARAQGERSCAANSVCVRARVLMMIFWLCHYDVRVSLRRAEVGARERQMSFRFPRFARVRRAHDAVDDVAFNDDARVIYGDL